MCRIKRLKRCSRAYLLFSHLIKRAFCSILFQMLVFLKYYHVEILAKLYEEQLRKIILVQSCVRRWLARVHYRRTKTRMAQSAMTVQRYVRGWLTRKRLHQMRTEWEQRQKEEQLRQNRRQSIKERESKWTFYFLAHLEHGATNTSSSFVLDMQQQVQKALARKKVQEKQKEHVPESRVNNARDHSTENNEKCRQINGYQFRSI